MKRPCSFVISPRDSLVRTFVNVIAAPGIRALVESITMPEIEPLTLCATVGVVKSRTQTRPARIRYFCIRYASDFCVFADDNPATCNVNAFLKRWFTL